MAGPIRAGTEAATFIPEIWAQEGLRQLKAYTQLARLVNRDYENEVASKGDTIHINSYPAFTAQSMTDGDDVTLQQQAMTKVALTLDNYYDVSFLITDVARAQANPEMMSGFITSAMVVLAEKVESTLLAEYANAANVWGTAAVDLDLDDFPSALKYLIDNKVPRLEPKWCVISTKDALALRKSGDLREFQKSGSTETLREGSIGRLSGVDIYESQLVPTSGSPLQTHNLMGAKSSIALAIRPLPSPAVAGVQSVNVDSGDGFGFRMLWSWNSTKKGIQVSIDLLWGIKTLRTGAHLVEVRS